MVLKKWTNKGTWPNMFDDMLENFFEESHPSTGLSRRVPDVNVKETNEAFDIEVAAPGMEKDDFNVNLDRGVLTISAESEKEDEKEGDRYTRKEFNYSTFKRSFTLPDSVKVDDISAEYDNGVLRIILPKKEEAKEKESARQIDIK